MMLYDIVVYGAWILLSLIFVGAILYDKKHPPKE